MANQPLYPNAKPIDCDVLILCEGDAVGYETKLLKDWADATELGERFIQVLACGTSEALYGVADAIGRTVPIIVLEDRDFRTIDEAKRDCEKKAKNRERRNIAMRGWFAWRRAEIENYFIDDELVSPVYSRVFQCSEDDVRNAARTALGTLAVSQALEYALYRARKSWLSTDANRALRVESIQWSPTGPAALTATEVRAKLEKRLSKWQQSLHDGTTWEDPMSGQQLLNDFDAMCNQWADMSYENPMWRIDWACKEVLKHVRMSLTQERAGWWCVDANISMNWSVLNDEARDERDRFIERTVQPDMVNSVLEKLQNDDTYDLRKELNELANLIRSL